MDFYDLIRQRPVHTLYDADGDITVELEGPNV